MQKPSCVLYTCLLCLFVCVTSCSVWHSITQLHHASRLACHGVHVLCHGMMHCIRWNNAHRCTASCTLRHDMIHLTTWYHVMHDMKSRVVWWGLIRCVAVVVRHNNISHSCTSRATILKQLRALALIVINHTTRFQHIYGYKSRSSARSA